MLLIALTSKCFSFCFLLWHWKFLCFPHITHFIRFCYSLSVPTVLLTWQRAKEHFIWGWSLWNWVLGVVARWYKPVPVSPLLRRSVPHPASLVAPTAEPTSSWLDRGLLTKPVSWPQTSQACINTMPVNHLEAYVRTFKMLTHSNDGLLDWRPSVLLCNGKWKLCLVCHVFPREKKEGKVFLLV